MKIYRNAIVTGSEQAVYDLRLIHELNIRFTSPEYRRNNIYRNTVLSALDDLPNHPLFLLKLCQVERNSYIVYMVIYFLLCIKLLHALILIRNYQKVYVEKRMH